VQVVNDQLCVGQPDLRVGERSPVGGGRVQRGDLDPGPPGRGLGRQPGPQHLPGASLDDVEGSAPGQIHDHGDVAATPASGGAVHDLLVHPDRHTGARLGRVELLVGEQPGGGVLDRPHHRLPAHPELACHLRDGAAELPDLTGLLRPRALGQHRPRQDVRMAFPPRAVAVPTAPLPLVPHQPGGLRTDREVTDLGDMPPARDPGSAVGGQSELGYFQLDQKWRRDFLTVVKCCWRPRALGR